MEENVSTEHQPTQEKDPIDVPKFNISQYVTVLPDGKAKGKCFWGFQGFISQVNVDDEGVSYEIKNASLRGNDRVVVPQERVVISPMNEYVIRDGVKRGINVISRGSSYVESLKGKLKRLQGEKKLLRKKNITMEQTVQKLKKENLLLTKQNKKLVDEHEKVFNISFDAILNERGRNDSELMKKAKEEVRGGFRAMRIDAERIKYTRVSLDDMKERVEKMEQKLRLSVNEAASLQDELIDKTNELTNVRRSIERSNKKKRKVDEREARMKSKVERLETENEKLIMKLSDIESDERFKRVDANGSLGLTYKKLLQRLFVIGLSLEQVKTVVEETFGALGVDVDSMSITYLRELRMDLGPLCDVLCGLKLAAATKYTQMDRDGSSIFGQDNMAVTATVEYADGAFEDVLIASSFLACSKDAESQALSIREVISRIKEKHQEHFSSSGLKSHPRLRENHVYTHIYIIMILHHNYDGRITNIDRP